MALCSDVLVKPLQLRSRGLQAAFRFREPSFGLLSPPNQVPHGHQINIRRHSSQQFVMRGEAQPTRALGQLLSREAQCLIALRQILFRLAHGSELLTQSVHPRANSEQSLIDVELGDLGIILRLHQINFGQLAVDLVLLFERRPPCLNDVGTNRRQIRMSFQFAAQRLNSEQSWARAQGPLSAREVAPYAIMLDMQFVQTTLRLSDHLLRHFQRIGGDNRFAQALLSLVKSVGGGVKGLAR
ncbi:MAG: hypothetical protein ACR65T_17745 [Methylocystis sp.]|uniref:hypothetical protein n=1 Tax=Methylocystis sp. TaxID=1911079 RepID=UPI003DA60799